MLIQKLDEALKAAAVNEGAVIGVSIGNRVKVGDDWITDAEDKRTWRVDYDDNIATSEDRAAVQAAVQAFNVFGPRKDAGKVLVDRWYQQKARALTSGYTDEEIFTWARKAAMARAIDAGSTATHHPAPIDAEATARGITRADLVARILAKDDAFSVAMLRLTGQKAKAQNDIDAARSQSEIDTVILNLG